MKRHPFFTIVVCVSVAVCCLSYAKAHASGLELVNLLTRQLSVTEKQAEGGAGSIFQVAKNNLSAEDFSKIATKGGTEAFSAEKGNDVLRKGPQKNAAANGPGPLFGFCRRLATLEKARFGPIFGDTTGFPLESPVQDIGDGPFLPLFPPAATTQMRFPSCCAFRGIPAGELQASQLSRACPGCSLHWFTVQ